MTAFLFVPVPDISVFWKPYAATSFVTGSLRWVLSLRVWRVKDVIKTTELIIGGLSLAKRRNQSATYAFKPYWMSNEWARLSLITDDLKKKTQLNQNHTLIQRKILTIKRFKYMYIINVSLFKTTLVWRALLKHNTRTNPKAGLYVWREDFLKSLSKLRSDEQTLSSRSRSWKLDISPVLFSTRTSKESGSGWNATGVYPLCL